MSPRSFCAMGSRPSPGLDASASTRCSAAPSGSANSVSSLRSTKNTAASRRKRGDGTKAFHLPVVDDGHQPAQIGILVTALAVLVHALPIDLVDEMHEKPGRTRQAQPHSMHLGVAARGKDRIDAYLRRYAVMNIGDDVAGEVSPGSKMPRR